MKPDCKSADRVCAISQMPAISDVSFDTLRVNFVMALIAASFLGVFDHIIDKIERHNIDKVVSEMVDCSFYPAEKKYINTEGDLIDYYACAPQVRSQEENYCSRYGQTI